MSRRPSSSVPRAAASPYPRRTPGQPKSTRQQFSACGACRMRRSAVTSLLPSTHPQDDVTECVAISKNFIQPPVACNNPRALIAQSATSDACKTHASSLRYPPLPFSQGRVRTGQGCQATQTWETTPASRVSPRAVASVRLLNHSSNFTELVMER